MKVIKNGFVVGNKIYGDYDDLYSVRGDEYGSSGVIINDDGSYTEYNFRGIDAMFDRRHKEKPIVKLTWWQKLKQKLFK